MAGTLVICVAAAEETCQIWGDNRVFQHICYPILVCVHFASFF